MMVNVRLCGDIKLAVDVNVNDDQVEAYNEYNTIEELLDFQSELKVLAEIIEKRDYTLGTDYRFKQIMDVLSMMLLCAYKESLIETKKEGKRKISEPLFEESDMPDFFQVGFDPGFKPGAVFNEFDLEPTTESFSRLLTELRNTVAHGTCSYNFLTGLISLDSNGLKGKLPLKQLLALMNMHFNDKSKRVMDETFSIPILIGSIPSLGFNGTDDFHLKSDREVRRYLDNLYVIDVHVKNIDDKEADITYGEIYDLLSNLRLICSTQVSNATRVGNLKGILGRLGDKYKELGVELDFNITKLDFDRERYKRVRKDINIAGDTFFEEEFNQKEFIINSLTLDKMNIKLMNNFLRSITSLYFRTPNITLEASDIDPSSTTDDEFNEWLEDRRKEHVYKSNDYVLCLFEVYVFCYYGLCCKLFKDGYFGLDLDNFDIDVNYIYLYINNKIAKLNGRKTNELSVLQGQLAKGNNDKASKTRQKISLIEKELEEYQELLTIPLEDMLSSDIVNKYIYESIRNAVVHQHCSMSEDKRSIIIKDIDHDNGNVCTFAATVDKQVIFNMIRESNVAIFLGLLSDTYEKIKAKMLLKFKSVIDMMYTSDSEYLKQYIKDVQESEPHKAVKP